jgi:hypothetical protein
MSRHLTLAHLRAGWQYAFGALFRGPKGDVAAPAVGNGKAAWQQKNMVGLHFPRTVSQKPSLCIDRRTRLHPPGNGMVAGRICKYE